MLRCDPLVFICEVMNDTKDESRTQIASTKDCREGRAQEMPSKSNIHSRFSLQRLSLDSAVAPFLNRPTAPFDRTERKRAHTSALYYSECFLRGIEPVVADTAAFEAQGKYEKWWVHSTAKHVEETESSSKSSIEKRSAFKEDPLTRQTHASKRRKINDDEKSAVSANVVSVSTSDDSANAHTDDDSSMPKREEKEEGRPVSISHISTLTATRSQIHAVKAQLVAELRASGGSVETVPFLECLDVLEAYYRSKSWDGRGSCKSTPFSLEGNWLTLSKPTYNECKGRNEKGEYTYSLGRMAFDMFKPTNLVCSMQAAFNNVRPIDPRNPDRPLHVPKKLMKDIQRGGVNLTTYE